MKRPAAVSAILLLCACCIIVAPAVGTQSHQDLDDGLSNYVRAVMKMIENVCDADEDCDTDHASKCVNAAWEARYLRFDQHRSAVKHALRHVERQKEEAEQLPSRIVQFIASSTKAVAIGKESLAKARKMMKGMGKFCALKCQLYIPDSEDVYCPEEVNDLKTQLDELEIALNKKWVEPSKFGALCRECCERVGPDTICAKHATPLRTLFGSGWVEKEAEGMDPEYACKCDVNPGAASDMCGADGVVDGHGMCAACQWSACTDGARTKRSSQSLWEMVAQFRKSVRVELQRPAEESGGDKPESVTRVLPGLQWPATASLLKTRLCVMYGIDDTHCAEYSLYDNNDDEVDMVTSGNTLHYHTLYTLRYGGKIRLTFMDAKMEQYLARKKKEQEEADEAAAAIEREEQEKRRIAREKHLSENARVREAHAAKIRAAEQERRDIAERKRREKEEAETERIRLELEEEQNAKALVAELAEKAKLDAERVKERIEEESIIAEEERKKMCARDKHRRIRLAAARTEDSEVWRGTAIFCGYEGVSTDCDDLPHHLDRSCDRKVAWTMVRRDGSGDGATCWTGWKVLCRQNFKYTDEKAMYNCPDE